MADRLAFLGPAGSYCEQAAIAYGPNAELVPFTGIPAVVASVDQGLAEEAVVPIENSLEGGVTFTLDLLIHQTDLKIKHEVVVPIEHCLLVDGDLNAGDIEAVYSHPQGLAQCRAYLTRNMPDAAHVASLSTSGAVEDMRNSSVPAAAISSLRAAQLYDARILERGIEDEHNNQTRFVVLAREDQSRTGTDKTSICFDFRSDAPGMLHAALGELARRDINLVKIESRPDRRSLGRYVFLIDMEGHRTDPQVADALGALESAASMFKVLGSYPMSVNSAVK
ncbi:MAG: prephenate dehydratase [SAR202 cluster bacterium]|jgi:prephenate dehydratase|nr:prephenate dehydratase [SAR202 cluster bacterium]MDP6800218.1 prephenate dehydratase [SAR202 cluster bacterium]MQG58668.1 prephenate dehydratase [SAR202 cluster bacterium]|tara:strand:+ start:4922 stop:5761 length:840 start_codon:yes stop_codon:yes gene_type:complete